MSITEHEWIVVVAGEPSGDRLAADVVREAKRIRNDWRFVGIGGPCMKREGIELVGHITETAAMGVWDSLCNLKPWADAYARLRILAQERNARAALLVDCPAVNFPLARGFRRDSMKILWFVGPKVWAWGGHRLDRLRACTDQVALVLPFERDIYTRAGVRSCYVGHPLADPDLSESDNMANFSSKECRKTLQLPPTGALVALLPGSRRQEVSRHWDVLITVAENLMRRGLCPVLAPAAGSITVHQAQQARRRGVPLWSGSSARAILDIADAALVASGTATLEAALAAIPIGVFYITDEVTYHLARRFIKVPYISLPNLISGKPIVREYVQKAVTSEALLREVFVLLSPRERRRQIREMANVSRAVRRPGVSRRVASWLDILVKG